MSLRGPLALFGISVLLLAVISWLVYIRELGQAEILLTLLVIAGLVILLAALGGLVALLSGFGMHDRREALGLPQGSIRAVIALSLILIFAMISVFLVGAMRGETAKSIGMTQTQITELGPDRVIKIEPGPSEGTFNVETLTPPSDMSQQLSQQLLTILGTLVTALVAFYFGQHSVTTAASIMKNAGGPGGVAGAVVGGAAGAAAGAAAGGAAGAAAGAGEGEVIVGEGEFEGEVVDTEAAGAAAGAGAGGAAGATAGAAAGEAVAAAEEASDAAAAGPDARSAAADAGAAAVEADAAAADAESAAKDAKTLSEDEI